MIDPGKYLISKIHTENHAKCTFFPSEGIYRINKTLNSFKGKKPLSLRTHT